MATRIDGIEIKHPCSASWAAMDGDARARFCKLCSKVVHDTTALTTCELEKMLDAPTPPCLRVHRDRAGRVLTRDRLAALAFVGLAACTGSADTGGYVDTAETGDVVTEVRTMGTGRGDRAGDASESVRAIGTGARDTVRGVAERIAAGVTEVVENALPVQPLLGEPAIMGRIVSEPEPEPIPGTVAPLLMGAPMPMMGKPALH